MGKEPFSFFQNKSQKVIAVTNKIYVEVIWRNVKLLILEQTQTRDHIFNVLRWGQWRIQGY